MADAKKCDRCGKFFTMDDFDETPTFAIFTRMSNWYCDISKDLCPSCSEALERFMKLEPVDVVTFKLKFDDRPAYSKVCGAKHCRPSGLYEE